MRTLYRRCTNIISLRDDKIRTIVGKNEASLTDLDALQVNSYILYT